MKPCECKDRNDLKKLNEVGLSFNDYEIEVDPSRVYIRTPNAEIKLSMTNFERFAKWYLEDQKKQGG